MVIGDSGFVKSFGTIKINFIDYKILDDANDPDINARKCDIIFCKKLNVTEHIWIYCGSQGRVQNIPAADYLLSNSFAYR